MDSFLLMLIATSILLSVKANDEPQIEIYEIRKPRDHSNRLDFQYYDPNEDQLEYRYNLNNREHNKMRDLNVDLVTNNLIDKLRRIVNSKYYNSKIRDDYISSYRDLKDENDNIFEDKKTPVILIADDKMLYHLIPEKSRSIKNKLQSVLRSINFEDDVEDRTAPPRTKIAYDYDYD